MKKRLVAVLLVLFFLLPLSAQRIRKMEFKDQPVVDILLVLAQSAGVSIVPDETVSGNASFFFTDSEFEEALGLFLGTYKLHFVRDGRVYYVSRVLASYDADSDLASLIADEVDLVVLVRSLSKSIGKTILYDSLPRTPLTINAVEMSPAAILEMLFKRFPEYRVEPGPKYYYIRRLPAEPRQASDAGGEQVPAVTKEGELYTLALEKGRFLDTLIELFSVAGREYSLLTRLDSSLENLYFSARDFDSLLRLILEQGSADYTVSDGVYYIFEIQKKDVLKKLRRSEILRLNNIVAQDVTNILPSDLAAGNLLRIDRGSNSVVLTGSEEEIGPVKDFLLALDRPLEGLAYHRFDVKYLKVRDLIAIIPQKLLPVTPLVLPEGNSFVALLPEGGEEALQAFLSLVDKKAEGFPVRLRYIKTEELLKNLPPSVSKEDIVDSGSPGLVFFVGSEDKRRLFLREVELVDRPKPQVRYELLVVQYQRSDGVDWSKTVEFGANSDAASAVLSGNLEGLLSLNLDVLGMFGYEFAVKLSLELSNTRARIFADTTLNGLSGQDIKFQNTDTFRYREVETDPDTGEVQYTGVSREITSGLIVGINGWVSGNGMVTMAVNATVSKRGEDNSSTTGNPPTTSEKVLTTNVRTVSGKPVVIGGLLQRSKDASVKKVPLLGDIPLLGFLFRDIKNTESETEMVIYIVPHVGSEDEADLESAGRRMESFYNDYIKGYIP